MSDIQRIPFPTEQVTIPQTNITDAPLPERSPIAELVGQAAQVAGNVAETYQKAQFAFDATEANLEITKRINAYQENLRNNPIMPVVGENIVQTKQKDWQNFSEDLMKNYISQIDNSQLRNVLTDDWNLKSEKIRNDVVNDAIDENIMFMANRLSDDINELVLAGDFEGADKAIALGEQSALLDREQTVDFYAFVDRSELLAGLEANNTSFSEGKDIINSSNLPVEEKGKAQNIWQEREDERIRVEKESLIATQESNLEEGFLGISRDQIRTMTQLDDLLEDGGRYEANDSGQGERLRAALRRRQKERDTDTTVKDDPASIRRIEQALDDFKGDDIAFRRVLAAEATGISGKTYNTYFELSQKQAFAVKNDQATNFFNDQVEAMAKQGFWGKDPTDILNGQNEMYRAKDELMFSDSLTSEQIASGEGFTLDMSKQLVANFQDQIVGKLLRDQPIREDNGQFHWTDVEKLIEHGIEGRLFGRTNMDQLSNFLNDSTMATSTLQDNVARDTFNRRSYNDLSKDEKNRVNVTVAVGQLVRKAEDVFKLDYPGVDAIMGIEIETNLPTARTADGLYRLELEGAEEKWKIWNGTVGDYIEDDTVDIADTSTTEELQAVKAWRFLQDVIKLTPDPDREEIRTRRSFLEVNEDLIPQGTPARSGRLRGIGQ